MAVSFRDCKTRAEARAKFCAWLDNNCIEQVRAHEARLVAANEDIAEIRSQCDQMVDFLATQCHDARARFEQILTEAGRP